MKRLLIVALVFALGGVTFAQQPGGGRAPKDGGPPPGARPPRDGAPPQGGRTGGPRNGPPPGGARDRSGTGGAPQGGHFTPGGKSSPK
jgi:hypothetical protein